jgi:signal transduction histidine kinase
VSEISVALSPDLRVTPIVLLGLLAVVGLLSWPMARSISRPIDELARRARGFGQSHEPAGKGVVGAGEVADLSQALDAMTERIGVLLENERQLLANVSHELRTPLTAIGGWSETLLSGSVDGPGGFDDPEEVKKGLTIIKNEATRLTRMVEELLDFSRMESGGINMQMERIDILPEIEEVVFMYMDTLQKEGMKLEYDEDDELPEIIGDRGRLKQVFFNILDNALKHGRDGRRIHVSAKADQKNVVVRVADFGAGIAPEELPLVKNRFYKGSSKARGSGIGLAVADEIIKLHGGRLDIESKLGEGTTVTITLPVAQG